LAVTTPAHAAAGASADLDQALEGMQFGSLTEVQAFARSHTQQRNRRPIDEFHGLSPELMHRMLHFPFAFPELVLFPDVTEARQLDDITLYLGWVVGDAQYLVR